MTVSISRKKWSRFSLSFFAALVLTGCYSFGLEKLETPAQTFELKACEGGAHPLRYQDPRFQLQLRYQGEAPALATAQNLFGRTTRFVVPYTRQTLLFELEIENTSAEVLRFSPEQMRLMFPNTQKQLAPLNLNAFKQFWPAAGVWSAETLLDRAAALGEVTRTLWGATPILPQAKQSGFLAFPRFELQKGEKIELEFLEGQESQNPRKISLCLIAN